MCCGILKVPFSFVTSAWFFVCVFYYCFFFFMLITFYLTNVYAKYVISLCCNRYVLSIMISSGSSYFLFIWSTLRPGMFKSGIPNRYKPKLIYTFACSWFLTFLHRKGSYGPVCVSFQFYISHIRKKKMQKNTGRGKE